jgi:hypothetical protein
MPVVQSISIYRGEDVTFPFTMSPPKDITGWVISFTVSKSVNSPVKLMQVTATITSGPNGTFNVILTSAQTDIEPGNYYYDVFRVTPGNNRILSVGEFNLKGDAREP